jgi:hypothetical protein
VTLLGKLSRRAMDLLPVPGFHFDRPLVLFQSDDWGRAGLRDQEGWEQLRAAGLDLGERPYDLYTLETAEDLAELRAVLKRHRDSRGRHPCLEMNFIVANLDFSKMSVNGWNQIRLLPLAEGLPAGWLRTGLVEAYREGIADRVFQPALHGSTHFCRRAVERALQVGGDRIHLLRTLWQAGTPYIYWRTPWIGYEYWDPEKPENERFLSADAQRELIGQTVGAFAKLFSSLPRSACAPGYRANQDTHRAWAQHGIRIVQNGPGRMVPPHFDRQEILEVSRTVEFEPATDRNFSLAACLEQAELCFARGIPAVISLHSINFHSTVRDFRSATVKFLDQFLFALESRHRELLYVHDAELWELVQTGSAKGEQTEIRIGVTKKKFTNARAVRTESE